MDMDKSEDKDNGLTLCLGSSPPTGHHHRREPIEPSLMLSISDEAYSVVSSFSAIKKEKDVFCDEAEVERVSSRTSDEDEDGNTRKKLRLTKEQSALLDNKFKEHSSLNPKQKQALAKQLNLRPRQVEVWFQNRRARTKLKQTETDCEFLKRCCETLTEQNRKLQEEVKELRVMKFVPPLYMQLPAATLAMCPNCERVTDGCDGSKGKTGASVVAPPRKPHFFNPFAHSATC